jgi:hypothetical protein
LVVPVTRTKPCDSQKGEVRVGQRIDDTRDESRRLECLQGVGESSGK